MRHKIILILFFVSIILSNKAFAQQVLPKKDSLLLYKNIESYSERNKFTKFIHQLLFKPVAVVQKKSKDKILASYSAFEGKIIRNINILTLDPFGYLINDTTLVTQNFLAKAGNSVHLCKRCFISC